MTSADRHNARTALAAAIIGKLIDNRASGPNERSQQRTVDPIDPKHDQPNANPAEDQDSEKTRQESKGCIVQDCQDRRIGKSGAI